MRKFVLRKILLLMILTTNGFVLLLLHQILQLSKLQHCDCHRRIFANIEKGARFDQTTCSLDAYERGKGQKVVSFVLYGNASTVSFNSTRGYIEGIEENLNLVTKYYPGWIMRLYFDLASADNMMTHLCSLACENDHLDLCHVANLPGTPWKDATDVLPMIWRFFPTLDPQVDLYLSRDLDSRISEREVAAVFEWLQIGAPLHIMRDHPRHNAPILGGTWGANLAIGQKTRKLWGKSWVDMMFDLDNVWFSEDGYGQDQNLLWWHVYNAWGENVSVQHDSYFCLRYLNTIGFPTRRRNEVNNFVGAPSLMKMKIWSGCPRECRREGHMDWENC